MRSLIDIVAMPSAASSDIDNGASGSVSAARAASGVALPADALRCIANYPTGQHAVQPKLHQHGALQMLVPLLLARAPPPPAGKRRHSHQ